MEGLRGVRGENGSNPLVVAGLDDVVVVVVQALPVERREIGRAPSRGGEIEMVQHHEVPEVREQCIAIPGARVRPEAGDLPPVSNDVPEGILLVRVDAGAWLM